MEISIELLRPVNPTGRSFITNVYGAIAANNREIIDKYKKDVTKLIQRLGFKIEESIGTGKLITGTIVIVLDDNTKEPKKMYTKDIKIWNIEREYNETVEVSL
ncbi:hypothetical protein Nps_01465 [Candidatus Nanopusillus acidilobi]|nr:hypothetical protein Nps_01465 [Candidatus Nanopusillus acidilobi]